VLACALLARAAVLVWARGRFPPTADGVFYDTLAQRLAHGDGYTWLWPDGVVTHAAHYPVGYPAMLAVFYSLFGASPAVAACLNAIVGAVGSVAMYRLASDAWPPRQAFAAGLLVAVHPALLPYTVAVMTEGVTASLLVTAAALASASRASSKPWAARAAAGAVLGLATLVRPPSLLMAPILGALAAAPGEREIRRRLLGALLVTGIAVACCLPWTVRNCARMNRCALVSVNGGWNLLIGTQTGSWSFAEVIVPGDCREVWDEAAKDSCFERAALRAIAADPGAWLARAPAKLAATFDYIGASPWYMHASNPGAFDDEDKLVHGAIETVVTRVLLALGLVAAARLPGPRARARAVVAAVALLFAVTTHAWVAYLALVVAIVLRGGRENLRGPLLVSATAPLLFLTAVTHAAFFGAGRYGLVVLPFVTGLAAAAAVRWGASARHA